MKNKSPQRLVAGVDEVGRGPLAGPVVAAAVIFDIKKPVAVADSKALSKKQREQIYEEIILSCISYGIGQASVEEIDAINILQASLLAMKRAVLNLSVKPSQVLIDGRHVPELDMPTIAIIGGDQSVAVISAAAIIAKVERDRWMEEYDQLYPAYGFAAHKGYGTKYHQEQLKAFGPCPIHRRSFAPVRELLENIVT